MKRYVIEVEQSSLGFADNAKLFYALAILQEYGNAGSIDFREEDVRSKRKVRRDAGARTDDLQPQTETVYKELSVEPGGMTRRDLAERLGLNDGAIGGQLAVLMRKGLVSKGLGRPARYVVLGRPIPEPPLLLMPPDVAMT